MTRSIFARSIFARSILAFGIALGSWFSATLLAEESRPPPGSPTPVTRQEVWQAVLAELRVQGLSDEKLPAIEDLDLPVALPARPGRTLRISSVCWDAGRRRTEFHFECGAPGQCLPFLAYVRDDVHGNANAGGRAGSCRVSGSRLPQSRLAPEAAPQSSPQPTVRPGDRATAVFLFDRLRMTTSVTCLQRGREGEVIRVRGPDGRIFQARISGPALLEVLQ
jgi:hypothetical protein